MTALSSSTPFARAGRWLLARPFTVVGALLLMAMAIVFCRRQDSEWEQVYLPAAAHLWNGEDIYRPGEAYLYPPFMALASLPFVALPSPLPRVIWFGINAVCLLALLRWSWQVAGGGRLEGSETVKRCEQWSAILGFLCGISYLENCLAHQQTDIVIAMFLAGGCLLLIRGRAMAAATVFGIAAACKCTALLWAPYLLWRGRPLVAAWVLLIALGVNLLPDLVSPAPEHGFWLAEYTCRFLKPLTAPDRYIGTWGSEAVYNQSLPGLAHRWCTTTWAWRATDCTIEKRLPCLGPKTLRIGVYGVELSLLAAVLCIGRRRLCNRSEISDVSQQALECNTVLLLMVLFSPMSSKAHFGTLILPGFCLARTALRSQGWLLKGMLAGAVMLGLLCNKDPLGEKLYTLSLWYGLVTWQALLLLAGCLFLYYQKPNSVFGRLPCPATAYRSATQRREKLLIFFRAKEAHRAQLH